MLSCEAGEMNCDQNMKTPACQSVEFAFYLRRNGTINIVF